MNTTNRAAIIATCIAIDACYDSGLSGTDDETLEHLIELGDKAKDIREALAPSIVAGYPYRTDGGEAADHGGVCIIGADGSTCHAEVIGASPVFLAELVGALNGRADSNSRRMLDASTGHLSPSVRDYLDTCSRHVFRSEHGYVLPVYEGAAASWRDEEGQPQVAELVAFAEARGFDFVMLDSDAPTVEGLPYYGDDEQAPPADLIVYEINGLKVLRDGGNVYAMQDGALICGAINADGTLDATISSEGEAADNWGDVEWHNIGADDVGQCTKVLRLLKGDTLRDAMIEELAAFAQAEKLPPRSADEYTQEEVAANWFQLLHGGPLRNTDDEAANAHADYIMEYLRGYCERWDANEETEAEARRT